MRMRERIVDIGSAGERLPASIWLPDKASRVVVLMGHGLGVDRYHESNRIPAELLVNSGTTVIAPERPAVRSSPPRRSAGPLGGASSPEGDCDEPQHRRCLGKRLTHLASRPHTTRGTLAPID